MALSKQELRSHLDEQMLLLADAAARFDAGLHPAFKQMAVSLRVLLHDTQQSTALLTHIGVKEQMQWLAGGRDQPGNLLNETVLAGIQMATDETSMTVSYVARDAESCLQRGVTLDFATWWSDPVIRLVDRDVTLSRRNIVLYVANKSGGAHIDAIPPALRDIEMNNAIGWRIGSDDGDSVALDISPIPATVRTIAEEVQLSVSNQMGQIQAALKI